MSHGLRVVNDSGEVYIDDQRVNYVYLGTYTASRIIGTIVGSGGATPSYSHRTPVGAISSSRAPIVAFSPPVATASQITTHADRFDLPGASIDAVVSEGGGAWTVYLCCTRAVADISVYVFAPVDDFPIPQHGVLLLSGDGDVLFSSAWRPVKRKGYTGITVPAAYYSEGGVNWLPVATAAQVGDLVSFAANVGNYHMPISTDWPGFRMSPVVSRVDSTLYFGWGIIFGYGMGSGYDRTYWNFRGYGEILILQNLTVPREVIQFSL